MITCSLGDDGVPSYEDTCNFTCNTGYELTGSGTRTCQSNGSWSGTDNVCKKGMFTFVHNYVLEWKNRLKILKPICIILTIIVMFSG